MATPSSKPASPSPQDPEQPNAPADSTQLQGFEGWEDVTELCRLAASMLGPNEMIHDSDFSLYGAMSALELMDAKMDKAPPALEVRQWTRQSKHTRLSASGYLFAILSVVFFVIYSE